MNRACTNDGCACTPNASIRVGTHETNPSMDQCTDCQSYQKCQ